MIRLLLTLVLIAFATQGDASLIVVSGGAGSAESGGGSGGWTAASAAESETAAGAIAALPYVDMFSTNISNRDEVPSVGSVAWGAESSGWNGERSMLITYGSSYTDEDDAGLIGRGAQGSPGSAGIPGVRRLNVGYLIKWDTTNNSYGIGDSSKAFWAYTQNNAGNRLGGGSRPSAVFMNYASISGFPSLDSGYDYQLPTPMLGVAWAQMPFLASSAVISTFAPRPSNGDTWFWWEFEVNLNTGLIAWFACEQGEGPVLVTAYNVYAPTNGAEGGTPATLQAQEGMSDAQTNQDVVVDAMLPSWYFKHSPSRQVRISHYRLDDGWIGPPDGFASSYSRPSVGGQSYQTGYSSGPSTLALEAADQP